MCATNQNDYQPDKDAVDLTKPTIEEPAASRPKPSRGHPSHIPKVFSAVNTSQNSPLTRGLSKLQSVAAPLMCHPKLRMIFGTSQPAHGVAIIAVAIVFTCLTGERSSSPKPYSALTTFAYLASFALRIGSQYWMTFVSGLSLYFTLGRHAFGDVQVVLFPRYFTSNAIFSAITLLSFSKLHSHIEWETKHWVQMIVISTSFLLEALARLYLAPKLVNLIVRKKAIEVTQPGVGKEVGKHDPGALAMCPHYMDLHRRFRRQHIRMALINVTTIACTVVQLCYISQSLCIPPC